MQTNSFRLRENPSRNNADSDFLLLTPSVEKLLKELTYAIRFQQGLIVFTGDAGTGKTTLIHRLLRSLHQHGTPVAFISDTHLDVEQLYRSMLMKFGATLDSQLGSPRLALKKYLSERARAGNTAVLIVDEAEGLSLGVLEEIRMLLNLETPREKLLSIVLVGGPVFEEMLRRPELYQFKQRITLRFKTVPFETAETHRYIRERLLAAGAPSELRFFSPGAMNAIHSYSRGVPGLANLLCEHALARALAQNIQPVPARVVAEIARDLELGEVEIAPRPQAAVRAESDEPTEIQPLLPIPSPAETTRQLDTAAPASQVSPAEEEPIEIQPLLPIPSPAEATRSVDTAAPASQVSQPEEEPTEIQPLLPIPSLAEATRPVDTAARASQVSQPEEEPNGIQSPAATSSLADSVEHADECVAQVPPEADQQSTPADLSPSSLTLSDLNETADELRPDAIALSSETVSDPPAHPTPEIPVNSPVIEPVEAGVEMGADAEMGADVEASAGLNPSTGRTTIIMPRWRRLHSSAGWRRWLRTPMDPARILRRPWSRFQALRLAVLNPTERARMRVSLFRWLREPFDPIRWLEQTFNRPASHAAMVQRETRADQ